MPGNLPYQWLGDTYPGPAFEGLLPPAAALALMAAYVLLPLGAAVAVLRRRDA
ncbi:hypothetical protein [Streptomonospora litoralis]|uniref:Uncharacterized protein n=1 Tax=Streptomonospora litoralis TaxID=2498135 RepID=A0A4P6Q3N7_9ACTN|nr:hypothetical protein [Streptomonospora litoralis]QBI55225.1 hypothetical protein EKD16_17285 [Streptomonospora litoralis]